MRLLLFPLSTDCLSLILSLCARIYLILWVYLIALVCKKQIVTECSFSLLFYSIFEQGVGRAFWCVCFTKWKASDKIYHQVTHRYDHTRCLCPCQRHWVAFRKKYMRFTVLWTSTNGYNVLIRLLNLWTFHNTETHSGFNSEIIVWQKSVCWPINLCNSCSKSMTLKLQIMKTQSKNVPFYLMLLILVTYLV